MSAAWAFAVGAVYGVLGTALLSWLCFRERDWRR